MGVLKVRSNGAWIDVGVGGGPLPPGGVAGDILVKNSATNSDALWGTAMPRLTLTSSTAMTTLTQADTGLQLGLASGPNMIFDRNSIQARDNGAAASISINELGAQVIVGGGTDPYLNTLMIRESAHATSRRAALAIGTGWGIGQDLNANGGKDFYVFSNTGNRTVMSITNTGDIINMGGGISGFKLVVGGPGAATLQVGDDCFFQDLNITNGIALRGIANAGLGKLGFGTGADSIGYDGELRAVASNTFTIQANTVNCLNSASNAWKFRSDANNVFETWGQFTAHGSIYADNELYTGTNCWFRVRGGGTGIYWESYGAGWYMPDSGRIRVYGSKLVSSDKWCGAMYYDQSFFSDPGASMAGYGWHPGGIAGALRMQVNSPQYHFNNTDGGGYYNTVASSYNLGSSKRYKQEIVSAIRTLPELPHNPVATMVRGLRPVWYRQREDNTMMEIPHRPLDLDPDEGWQPDPKDHFIHVCRTEGAGNCGHTPDDPCSWRVNWLRGQLGFIAEEVEQVLPQLVELDQDMNPATIDLGSLVGLAYAMLQELDNRLTALEAA